MLRPIAILSLFLMFLISVGIAFSADKKQARVERIGDVVSTDLRIRPSLSTADTCIVRHDQGIVLQIDGWVIGNELYKSYLDPSLSCTNPYPYTVTEINMPMVFAASTIINVSVDIESVDLSVPNCPFPDTIIAISSAWELQVPGAGVYDIWIPLDEPVVVNEPFFAGFFIGNYIDITAGAAVITDENPSAICMSYNIWDDTIGFIDLLNNSIWNFPGQLVLYASGVPGGNSGETQPAPDIKILSPTANQILMGFSDIWVQELSGSNIIDYVSFEYSSGGPFIEIGRDYDGTIPLRNGVDDAGPGDGFAYRWSFPTLFEGVYTLKATAYDTLGRTASDQVSVYLEPTPPTPTISSPSNGEDICPNFDFIIQNSDENLNRIDFYLKQSDPIYSAGLETLNIASFGSHFSASIASALLIKFWSDREYTSLMREGLSVLSVSEVVNRLADIYQTNLLTGDFDDKVYSGIKEYILSKGGFLLVDYQRNLDYFALRTAVEEEEKGVMIALGGSPGFWLAVEGFNGWKQSDGSYLILVSNPIAETISTISMRNNYGDYEVNFSGTWQKVDMMITTVGHNWSIDRNLIGSDLNGADGWSFNWTPDGLVQTNQYFFRAEGIDATSLTDASTIILNYDCSSFFVNGDFNNDGYTNIGDLNYLINYYLYDGPPPVGGAWRADTNCDNYLNFTDIVYLTNFIFGTSPPPCH